MLLQFARKPRTRVSDTDSLPAPVGGWNVRDALANMDKADAIILDNWFPGASDVMVRKGYTQWATGIGAQVETILPYNGPSTQKLFAAAATNIYDVTSGGVVGAAVVTSLSNARWQHTNVATSGGQFLYAVNGADKPLLYNGSTWTPIDSGSSPAISGVTTTNLIHVNIFKERVWFVEKSTLKAWYLPVASVGGTAAPLDLSAFCKRGGQLMAMGTWTVDAGSGVDDYAVFVTSEGEVLVYQGTDPTSSSTWALKGVWQLGSPIGRKCLLKFGGDLLLICVDGVVPLSRALVSSRVQPKVALTEKINGAMANAAQLYSANFGWKLLFYPKGSMLLLNIPVSTGSFQQQYAMNTITGSWGRFLNVSANCWELYQDEPYFGGNGFVGKFWQTFADNGGTIAAEAKQAFSYFGSRGQLKHFKEVRPLLTSNGSPAILAALNVDYDTNTPSGTLNFAPTQYAVWDSSLWDAGIWGGELSVLANWQTINGLGTAAALHLFLSQSGIDTHWQATDFLFERGGVI